MKSWYVEYLVEMLSCSEGDHEDLTAPLLVTASVKKEEFKTSFKDRYSYQVRQLRVKGLDYSEQFNGGFFVFLINAP